MKITTAEPLPDFQLRIKSGKRIVGIFDAKPYLDLPVFRPLKNPAEFAKVRSGGYYVEWECGADLSADTIEADLQNPPNIKEKSFEPTPEFAAYLDKEIANIKAGRDLISFENMDDAIAYLDKRKKR